MSLAPRLAVSLTVLLLGASLLAVPALESHHEPTLEENHSTLASSQFSNPMLFMENAGQGPETFKFLVQQPAYSAGFNDQGITVRVPEGQFTMSPGFTAEPRMEGNTIPIHYLKGEGRFSMQGGETITMAQDGVAWKAYFTQQGELEFDHILTGDISLAKLVIDAPYTIQDTLTIHLAGGDVTLSEPIAYQDLPAGRVSVDVQFRQQIDSIGYQVGAYNPAFPLIIDPILKASTYVGGTLGETPNDVAAAPDGSAYVVGTTTSLDFPVTDDELVATLADPPKLTQDRFGFSVDATPTRLAVGAPGGRVDGVASGLVYVYDSDLNLLFTLSEPNQPGHITEAGDDFGHSVQFIGDNLFVGAPGDDTVTTNGGSVYKFDINGNYVTHVDAPATQETAPGNPVEVNQKFGWVLENWNGNLVAGSPFEDVIDQNGNDATDAGALRVFSPSLVPIAGGFTAYWSELLYGSSLPAPNDQYAYSLASAGSNLLVGSPGDQGLNVLDPARGSIHLINPANNPVDFWILDPATSIGGERFGHSVAYMDSIGLHVGGAPQQDIGGTDTGSVYALLDNTCPQRLQPLTNPGASPGDQFGFQLEGSAARLAVGSVFDDKGATDSGVAYQYEPASNPGCGNVEITLSMEYPSPSGDENLGYDLAYFGETLAVSAPGTTLSVFAEGEVLIYDVEPKVWDSSKLDTDKEGWIAHYLSDGTLDFITFLGGTDDDFLNAVKVDEDGFVYLGGGTHSPDFPVYGQPYMSGNQGLIVAKDTADGFLTKMLPDGSDLVFSTYFGGTEDDFITDLDFAPTGIVVGGNTLSGDFPILISANGEAILQSSKLGEQEGFIARFTDDGSQVIYSTYYGGSGEDTIRAIAVDSLGYVYAAGDTYSPDLPVITIVQGGHSNDLLAEGFFVKIMHDGSFRVSDSEGDPGGPIYAGYLGGANDDVIYDIALDDTNRLHMVGQTASAAVFEPRFPIVVPAFQGSKIGGTDAFISILQPDGRKLVSSTYLGGGNQDAAYGVAVDDFGDVYVIGQTTSPDFPIVAPTIQAAREGISDAFVVKFQPDGKFQHYGTYFGGNGEERGTAIDVDLQGSVFIAGTTSSTDLELVNEHQNGMFGGYDAFVGKFEDKPPAVDFTHDAGSETPTLTNITFEDISIAHRDGDMVGFYFEFGDDESAIGPGPHLHNYSKAGTYTVTMHVLTDSGLNVSTSKDFVITNRLPEGIFSYAPESPTDYHTVQFTDESEDLDGDVSGWFWDFGDGETSDQQHPTHQYTPGTYTVTLIVYDDEFPLPGASESVSTTITVRKGIPAEADYTMSPLNPSAGDVITFKDNSNDPDGEPEAWHWDFGDGFTAEGAEVTHQFMEKAIYTITLTVTDDDGIQTVLQRDLDITNKAPLADFSRNIIEPTGGDLVKFFDLSDDEDGNIVSWHWDFHDGTTAQIPSPSHRFGVNDQTMQQVTLTVTDNNGATATKSVQFWVRAPGTLPAGGSTGTGGSGGYVAPVTGNVGGGEDGECPVGTIAEDGICVEVQTPACPDNQFYIDGKCHSELEEEQESEPTTGYIPQRAPEPESDKIPTGLWVGFIIAAVLLLIIGAGVTVLVVKRL